MRKLLSLKSLRSQRLPLSFVKSNNFCSQKEEIGKSVYLDMQSTTPIDFRVLDAMMPYMSNLYGNPHSRTHEYGWEAEKEVEMARKHAANLIKADPKEIIFTSGATESNNAALKGLATFYGKSRNHIITLQTVFLLIYELGT